MKIDDLIKTYIQVRSKKSQLKAKYELEKSKFDTLQDKIEALLLAKFAELGVDSVKTDEGTAYTAVQTSASIADWDSFRCFLDHMDDPFVFVERRVNKTAVEAYRAANSDLPPGLNWSENRVVNFRRA